MAAHKPAYVTATARQMFDDFLERLSSEGWRGLVTVRFETEYCEGTLAAFTPNVFDARHQEYPLPN